MTQPGQPGYDPTVTDWATRYDVAEDPLKHGIDETVTGGAFASVRDPGWHRLGTVRKDQCGALELLREAKCDFPIFRTPIFTGPLEVPLFPGVEGMEGAVVRYESAEDARNANIVRIHPERNEVQVLGQASKTYPLWTPRDVLVGFGDAIIKHGQPTVSTCGALDEGRRVFMSFELPEEIRPHGIEGEQIRLWLVVHTSFDTRTPTYAMLTPIRAVCANTLRVGVEEALAKYTIRKTRNADLQAAQAAGALGLVKDFKAELLHNAEKLLSTPITNDQFRALITDLWGPGDDAKDKEVKRWEERQDELVTLFAAAPTQASARGTAWGALQAVTEDRDWFSQVQGKKGQPVADPDAVRFARSIDFNKSVTDAKDAMAKRLLAMAG